MFVEVRRPAPELGHQSMAVLVDQRWPSSHRLRIARPQVHRLIAAARAARSFEDHGLDPRLEERQSSGSFHRLDDLPAPRRPTGVGTLPRPRVNV